MTSLRTAPDVSEMMVYLTAEFAPIPASIKRRYEDFVVEEMPAYEPCGHGDHCYFTIEKSGLSTMRAVQDIARALGVNLRDIGLAGLKDARAVSVQTLSLEHIDPARIEALRIPRIRILRVSRHTNKLKIGHLRGNRFRIKLRDVPPERIGDLHAICDILHRRGTPNYFGQQRFGLRGDSWEMGRAILKNDPKTLVDLILGTPGPLDTGPVLKARQLYQAGKFDAAAKAWPFGFSTNARMCRAMAKSGGRHHRAAHALDDRLKKFFVNAFQSYLFNRVLSQRIGEIDRVREGDLAYKHDNGAVFLVTDAAAEAPRAAAFEISPSGPIFAPRMTTAGGAIGELEAAVFETGGVTLDDFRKLRRMSFHGARRPLRFRPEDLTIESGKDHHGPFVELRFALPSGCYATMLLRELCKGMLTEALDEED